MQKKEVEDCLNALRQILAEMVFASVQETANNHLSPNEQVKLCIESSSYLQLRIYWFEHSCIK